MVNINRVLNLFLNLMSYWLQLKTYFESEQLNFPILLHRNAVLLMHQKQQQKLDKLNISVSEFVLPDGDRLTKVGALVRASSQDEIPQLSNVVSGKMSSL